MTDWQRAGSIPPETMMVTSLVRCALPAFIDIGLVLEINSPTFLRARSVLDLKIKDTIAANPA